MLLPIKMDIRCMAAHDRQCDSLRQMADCSNWDQHFDHAHNHQHYSASVHTLDGPYHLHCSHLVVGEDTDHQGLDLPLVTGDSGTRTWDDQSLQKVDRLEVS